jgi:tetratricopeptide (TPR) repeat protein/transglutaminase-like putative cysteine protease
MGFSQATPSQPPRTAADFGSEPYVVERVATRINVAEDGSNVQETEAQVRMMADAGVKAFAVLKFTYTSANQVVEVDYVRVRKPDGNVINTPEYNTQEMPSEITRSAPMYSDIREKHVTVKGLGVGDVLEYKTRTRTITPEVAGQFWYMHDLTRDAIVKDETLEVSVPAGKHLTVKSPVSKPVVREDGGKRTYTWKYSNLERRKEEDELPNPKREIPSPSIQMTTFASWEEIGRWYSGLQQGQIAVTPAIQAKARELTAGVLTDDDKIYELYKFVSMKIHYVGLDFGIGRYQPHPANDVLENEYGDCKDKHTLLAALLRAAGYDAWPALIHASQHLDPDVPSLSQFNHVMTVVPRGDELIWLDTTPEVAPYRLLLSPLRGKQALIMPSGKPARLMKVPDESPVPQEEKFISTATLGSDGVLQGHIRLLLHGDSEILWRAVLRVLSSAQWKDGVQKISYGMGFGGEVSNVTVKGLEELNQPLEISYDYLRKEYSDWDRRQILALMPPTGIERLGGARQKAPKEAIYLGAKGEIAYHSEIKLPAGATLTPNEDINLVESYAEYRTWNSVENGVLKTTRRLKIKQEEVPAKDWENLKKLAKVASNDTYDFMKLNMSAHGTDSAGADSADLSRKLNRAVEVMQQGDMDRGRKLLQEVLAADPGFKLAHYNLGVVFSKQKNFASALAEFRKEEEVNPQELRSYKMAAQVAIILRQKGDVIEEWRKLLRVAPQDTSTALQLGNVLSSEGNHTEAAMVLEKALQYSPENAGLEALLGTVYARDGHLEQGMTHLRHAAETARQSSPVNYMTLNDIAYAYAEKGVEIDAAQSNVAVALKTMDELSNSSDGDTGTRLKLTLNYGFVWDTAGWVEYKLGNLQRADSFVRAAWLLGQSGLVGEHLAEIYEKQGRTKEATHLYELAYDASSNNSVLQKTIAERYQKLTGKPLQRTHDRLVVSRLPNGEWPMMPGEELGRIRTVNLGTVPNLQGSADFEAIFTADGKQSVTFLSGSDALKKILPKLEHAKFQVEFPDGSHATLLRRITVVCSKYTPCTAVLTPVELSVANSNNNP